MGTTPEQKRRYRTSPKGRATEAAWRNGPGKRQNTEAAKIAKCEVVCANHHRMRTEARRGTE